MNIHGIILKMSEKNGVAKITVEIFIGKNFYC